MAGTQTKAGLSRLGLLVGIAAATVGIIYGYDSSNIGGAMEFLKEDLAAKGTPLDAATVGFITSVVVIGEILGALFGGTLANKIGRKPVMIGVALSFAIFSLVSGIAPNIGILIVARLLLGIAIGISIVVVPVYVAESSAPAKRGSMLVLYQVATVVGIILGTLLALLLAPTKSAGLLLGIAAIPGAIIGALLFFLPDTPRWYIMKGRIADAERVFALIEPEANTKAEVAEIAAEFERNRQNRRGAFDGIRELFGKTYFRAFLFVVGLGFFVQITGINAVVYYGPQIIKSMGFEGDLATFGLPTLVQVVGLISVFIAMNLVDRMGRRPVLLTGISIMFVAYLMLIVFFFIAGPMIESGQEIGALGFLGFAGLALFNAGFTFGFGALVWVYAGEAFPAHLRTLGASIMLTSDLVANFIVGQFFPAMLEGLGGATTYIIFAAFTAAAFVFVLFMAPETKGRQLEDIKYYWENGGKWPKGMETATAAAKLHEIQRGA